MTSIQQGYLYQYEQTKMRPSAAPIIQTPKYAQNIFAKADQRLWPLFPFPVLAIGAA